ncbi:hypothetical protein [Rhizobium mesosinicum]|uniref:Uncharacterized protein n=1 Tax=Rhizobium mesosinicum TaxID=335017 RepID=A0ABS7GRE3_9HYPH|nr:hypothetical protein [Rhizobium mesosinicum]MBW9052500.1 hypothetical protein [Rhizobium mesosinicum]
MKAEYCRDRRIDLLEFMGCGSSAGSEARAAIELFLLQIRPLFAPEPNAGGRASIQRRPAENEAVGNLYP